MSGHSRAYGHRGTSAPLAPWPAHARPLSAYHVGEILEGLRHRYLHLSDPTAWDSDGLREVAGHMAAGLKMALEDVERAIRMAEQFDPPPAPAKVGALVPAGR